MAFFQRRLGLQAPLPRKRIGVVLHRRTAVDDSEMTFLGPRDKGGWPLSSTAALRCRTMPIRFRVQGSGWPNCRG